MNTEVLFVLFIFIAVSVVILGGWWFKECWQKIFGSRREHGGQCPDCGARYF